MNIDLSRGALPGYNPCEHRQLVHVFVGGRFPENEFGKGSFAELSPSKMAVPEFGKLPDTPPGVTVAGVPYGLAVLRARR